MRPFILGFYGRSLSGKTTLIETLLHHFVQKGYVVASIKKTDKQISIDKKGKDTWRFAKAGATLNIFSSASETDFIIKGVLETKKIIQCISCISHCDLIFIEGTRESWIPKISFGGREKRENTIATFNGESEKVIELIQRELTKAQKENRAIVKVNGNEVPLSEFPSAFLVNSICGMLKSLKGVEDINEFNIHWKK
jgi:molybdopterin-guanine dinucleotide biosynthesis protein B